MQNVNLRFVTNGKVALRVAVKGSGPVILCIHGWPELWYSWRHQMRYFADRGFTVAAMDVRGYGGSDKPEEVSAYTLAELASDAAAVIRDLSDEPVILFGHDWGAPIAYATAMLHPDLVRGVAGLSVPFRPAGDMSMLDVMRQLFAGRFFYMLHFQQPAIPEAELERDIPSALRKIYYSASGDAPLGTFIPDKAEDSAFLDGFIDPEVMPGWMSASDLKVYAEAFADGGFRGPINRYRAQDLDFKASAQARGVLFSKPACFIGGERDPVRSMVPGVDLFADIELGYEDCRVSEIVAGAGHWLQQEAPEQVNAILGRFVASLH